MQHVHPLVSGCVHVLRQGLALLDGLDDHLYADKRWLPVRSDVSSHFRHCIDFYQSFLSGVRSGRIDYNRRERDALVERDRSFAITKIQIIIAELESLQITDGEARVLVSMEGESVSPDDRSLWCQSTVAREIQYLLSHTIHHYALVALMLRLQGFEPDEDFGVAPSTLKHWSEESACAQWLVEKGWRL